MGKVISPFSDLKVITRMMLFRSLLVCSDEFILELGREHASYIVSILRHSGIMKIEGSLYHEVKALGA